MKKYVALMDQPDAWIQRHRQEMIEELQPRASFPSVSRDKRRNGRDEAIAIRKLTDCSRIYVGALAALDDTI